MTPESSSFGVPKRSIIAICRLWWSRACGLLLLALVLIIVDSQTTRWLHASTFVLVYGGSIVIMSGIAFLAYWIDKRRAARASDRRIPESTLHVLGLMGGWPGAVIAQERFRHKTQKTSFRIMFWVTVLLHGFGITWTLWELSQKFGSKTANRSPLQIHFSTDVPMPLKRNSRNVG